MRLELDTELEEKKLIKSQLEQKKVFQILYSINSNIINLCITILCKPKKTNLKNENKLITK